MKNLKIISLGIAMLINYASYSKEVVTNSILFYISQEKTVTGTVTSDGVPLPGATVSMPELKWVHKLMQLESIT